MTKPPLKHATSPAAAFSLVELLVVIVVLAVLSSILIATLNIVRRAGQQVQALQNIRTVGQGVLLYTQENTGNIPAVNNPSIPAPRVWLFLLLHEGFLTDPIAQQQAGGSWVHGERLGELHNPITLAAHPDAYNGGGWGLNGFDNIRITHKIYSLDNPAATVLVADGYYEVGNNKITWGISGLGAASMYPNTFNSGSALYFFCDGHAEKIEADFPAQVNSPPVGNGDSVFFLKE